MNFDCGEPRTCTVLLCVGMSALVILIVCITIKVLSLMVGVE